MAVALDDVGKAAWTAELAKQCGKYILGFLVFFTSNRHYNNVTTNY